MIDGPSVDTLAFAAPGLSLEDIFATYATIPEAAVAVLLYEPKVSSEPPIMPYAQADTPK